MDFFTEADQEKGYSAEDKVVLGSVIAGGVLIVLGFLIYLIASPQFGGSLIILGFIVSVLPYGVISFLKNRAVNEVEDQFPNFLKDLTESKRGGMTLLQSFDSAKQSDYGRLNKEIEKIHDELTWGIPFPKVMERFSRRMSASAVIQESISILLQSFKSGGDITKTLESIADDSAQLRETIRQKDSKIKQQVLIMYVIFFLFVGITVGLYMMMGELLGLGASQDGALQNVDFLAEGEGGTDNFCDGSIMAAAPLCTIAQIFGFVPGEIDDLSSDQAEEYNYGQMAYYKSLLFVMLMVQGLCTAAVAGQISEGSPSGGIKHALIMMPIAFIVFMYTVGFAGV